ncbi:MAG: hypothetical protein IKB02_07495 [Clostridia bacterium]|nr:hypothetical protein [Clostridia bacterium]
MKSAILKQTGRKIIFFARFSVTLLLFALAFSVVAFAKEDKPSVPLEYSLLIDELDGKVFSEGELPEKLHSGDVDELGEAVGQLSTPEYLFSYLKESFGVGLEDALSLFATLCGILVLSAVFSAFKTSFSQNGARVLTVCSSAAIFASVLSEGSEHFLRVEEFFERIGIIMNGMIPVVSIIYAMGGNVSTAVASSGTLYIFLAFCEEVLRVSVLPVAAVSTAFALSGSVSGGIKLVGLSSALKKSYTFLLGLIMTLLIAVLSSQTLLSSAADTVSARAARLVASNVIPIVGSSVGDTVRTVSSSVGYLKSVCGIGGIIFILLLVLPILIKLLLVRGVFLFASSVADLVGCESEGKLLTELGSVYGILLAVVTMCSVMFILAITIFLRCGIALG